MRKEKKKNLVSGQKLNVIHSGGWKESNRGGECKWSKR